MNHHVLGSTPILKWWSPSLGDQAKKLVCEVIESNFPNDGDYTKIFEEKVAELCGVPYAVAVTSGTAAIFMGLLACGVRSGDEVIVPDVTFIATANAVTLAGATPVFVDVYRDDFNMDLACVQAAITARTKAIVPVHVSGRAANMPALMEIAQKHDLKVVEDAAEALGSRAYDRALGTIGDVGCFSFSANKTITTGQGGMIVVQDPSLHQRLRELKDQGRPVRGTGGADEHVSLGFNFKFTNLQAALGLAQIETLPDRLAHQRQLYSLYRKHLAGVSKVHLPEFNITDGECPQWVDARVEQRDDLHDHLLKFHIETRKFWYPLHTQTPYRSMTESRFPVSEEIGRKALWLPSSLSLTPEDVEFVSDHIRRWDKETG